MRALYFLVALAIISLFFLIQLFQPFLKPMIVALLLSFATTSLHIFIHHKTKSDLITSISLTTLVGILFFAPLTYFIISFARLINNLDKDKIIEIFESSKIWVENLPNQFLLFKGQLIHILNKIDVSNIFQNLLQTSAYLGKNSFSFMFDMVLILIFYFFFNYYAKGLSNFFKDILPIPHNESETLFRESSNVMSIVLYSILATAIFEGILFGVFISFYGYDGILLGVLYGFATLIPIVGGLVMWLPIAFHEYYIGNITNAIVITIYSIVVISIVADTFIKPMIIKYINKKVVKTPTSVNEMLIFFAILAGLSTFGFWGMIIGPAMVSFFISILHILKKYSNNVV